MPVSNPISITFSIKGEPQVSDYPVLRFEMEMGLSRDFRGFVTLAQTITPSTSEFLSSLADKVNDFMKATVTVEYKEKPIKWSFVANVLEVRSEAEAGSGLELVTFVLSSEWGSLLHTQMTGAYYSATAPQILEHYTAQQIKAYGLNQFTKTAFHFNDSDQNQYPLHPLYCRYEESDLKFIDRLLAEHGLFYSWIGSPKDQTFLVCDNWESFDAYIESADSQTKTLYQDQSLTYSLTTEGRDSVFNCCVQSIGGHCTDLRGLHDMFRKREREQEEVRRTGEPRPYPFPRELRPSISEMELVHYNPEQPEKCLTSSTTFPLRFNIRVQKKTRFNTLTQAQLDACLNTHALRYQYQCASTVMGHFGGCLLFPGMKLNVDSDKPMRWITKDVRVIQTLLSFTSPLLKHGTENLTGSQIKHTKNYIEAHTFEAKASQAEFREEMPPLPEVYNLVSVFPYRLQAYRDRDTILPNAIGSVPIIFPWDFEYVLTGSQDNRYYCPRMTENNHEKANHSAPFYAETELMLGFIDANPNKPIIRGALAHANTTNLDTDKHPNRHYQQSDQGSKFGYTSDRTQKHGNSVFFKSDHQNFEHSSFLSLSNLKSQTNPEERHLDHTVATTANYTEHNKGEYIQALGIDPTGKINKPNQFTHVKPARPVNEVAPAPKANELLTESIQETAVKYIKTMVTSFDNAMKHEAQLSSACNNGIKITFFSNRYNMDATGVVRYDADSPFRSVKFKQSLANPLVSQTLELLSGSVESSASEVSVKLDEYACNQIKNCSQQHRPKVLVDHAGNTETFTLSKGQTVNIKVPSLPEDQDSSKFINFYHFLKDVLIEKPTANLYQVNLQTCGQPNSPWVNVQSYPEVSWEGGFEFGYNYDDKDIDTLKKKLKDPSTSDDETGWYLNSTITIQRNKESYQLQENLSDFFPGLQTFLNQILPFLSLSTRYVKSKPLLPKISLSGKGQLIEDNNKPTVLKAYDLTLKFDPLLGYSNTIDILAILCDVFGWPFLVELRDKAEDGIGKEDSNFHAKATVKLNLNISGSISGTLNYSTLHKQSVDGSIKGEMSFVLEGDASGEIKAFIVKARAGIILGAKSAIGVELTSSLSPEQQPEIDGQLYFDGLVIYYMAYRSLEISSNDNDGSSEGGKYIPGASSSQSIEKLHQSGNEYHILQPRKWPEQPQRLTLDKFNGNNS